MRTFGDTSVYLFVLVAPITWVLMYLGQLKDQTLLLKPRHAIEHKQGRDVRFLHLHFMSLTV